MIRDETQALLEVSVTSFPASPSIVETPLETKRLMNSSGTISAAVTYRQLPSIGALIPISKETLSKYEVKDRDKMIKIHEALTKAKSVKMEKGFLYEVDKGVFVGIDKEGRLRIYLV
ncbi:MAG: hypothetical protein ABIM44_08190 [candidate division WOR-3 bacterium]